MEEIKRAIQEILKNNPNGLMAKDLARLLGENKTRINSILYSCPSEFTMNNYIWKNKSSDYDASEHISRVDTIPETNKNDGVKYHYFNCNPHHRLTDDCVIRAICSSTGESWEQTIRDLTEYSIKTGYMLNTPECYGEYLADKGYVKQKQPVHQDGTKVRFKEFVKIYDGHAICHCGKGHVTYVSDNSSWDIWDVSDEVVGNYWVNKAELDFVKRMEK